MLPHWARHQRLFRELPQSASLSSSGFLDLPFGCIRLRKDRDDSVVSTRRRPVWQQAQRRAALVSSYGHRYRPAGNRGVSAIRAVPQTRIKQRNLVWAGLVVGDSLSGFVDSRFCRCRVVALPQGAGQPLELGRVRVMIPARFGGIEPPATPEMPHEHRSFSPTPRFHPRDHRPR